MKLAGMLYGAKLLKIVEFPTAEVLGPKAADSEIKALIDRCGEIFIKPNFRGVGKKGKAGLVGCHWVHPGCRDVDLIRLDPVLLNPLTTNSNQRALGDELR